ncbi:MAG: class I SAM-dependent methyltransferase [Verrucomicrobia bacterium]|nr:class I SAM-dependent methyltransferase [Verrucomicrobiota bacterium]
MKAKYIALTDALYRYLCECRTGALDPVLDSLREETEALGDVSRMQISREQGSFLTILSAAICARSAVEIGTFTGYSAICIARGLAPGGRLIAVDRSQEWTAVAKRYWTRAGIDNRIELRLGDAIPILRNLEPGLTFDFAFIDGDKTEYDAYYELILPRLRPNGLVAFDNMLWGGKLGAPLRDDPSGRAIDAMNRKLASDSRVETVLLPVADGIQLCRKRGAVGQAEW